MAYHFCSAVIYVPRLSGVIELFSDGGLWLRVRRPGPGPNFQWYHGHPWRLSIVQSYQISPGCLLQLRFEELRCVTE